MSDDAEPAPGEDGPADAAPETDRVPPPAARKRRRRLVAAGALAVAIVVAVLLWLRPWHKEMPTDFRAVAVGSMVCDAKDPGIETTDQCKAQEVSDIAVSLQPDVFFGLGDYVFEVPKKDTYADSYGPSWGRLREITVPTLGNQEYKVHEANTFRNYFAERAGPSLGYWSTDYGKWHIVVLNSNCTVVVGGCLDGSPQQKWLAADLAANSSKCTVALMHHPRWSTGLLGPDPRLQDFFATMANAHVEMVLSSHEHHYERFPLLGADGKPNPGGTRQFIVGTGGQVVYEPGVGDAPWRAKAKMEPSEFVDFNHLGVLELTMRPDDYTWAFHAMDGTILDSGTTPCT